MTNYTEITSMDQWKEVLANTEQSALVLKHSTTCPISAKAYAEYDGFDSSVKKYLVKVIESRPISLEIAEDIGVQHQSPQAFLLKDGKAVWNTSHHQITADSLAKAVATV